MAKKDKVDYKALADVSDQKGNTTIKLLAAEFAMEQLDVSQILKKAGIAPVGKLPKVDDQGKPVVGKPALAYAAKEAQKAVQDAMAADKSAEKAAD